MLTWINAGCDVGLGLPKCQAVHPTPVLGSKTEVTLLPRQVRSTLRSRRRQTTRACPKSATSGLMHRSNYVLFNHLVGAGKLRSLMPQGANASLPSRTPADGAAGLADGGSCHAHTIKCPTRPAADSDLRNHAASQGGPLSYRLCFYWQRYIEPLSALTGVPGRRQCCCAPRSHSICYRGHPHSS
jgi:hypothetical protein